MKHILYISMGILALVFASCAPLTKAQEAELQAKVKQAVEGKKFRIAVNYVNPIKFQSRALSSEYDFAIKADSAFSYLPYFGESYGGSAAYDSNDGGIKFKEPMQEYKLSGNEKKGYEMSFRIKSPRDSYQIFLSVSTTGYASISITPTQSSQINYNGELVFEENAEK